MHQGDAGQLLVQGEADGHAHEPFGAFRADRLDADATRGDHVVTQLLEQSQDLLRFVAAALELDAAINVFGVFAEDDHVDLVGPLVGRFDSLEITHGPNAGVQVEAHAQEDVDAAEAAADGRGQRSFKA